MMKIIEIELSEQELCRAVESYLHSERGFVIENLEIAETGETDEGTVIRFRREKP